MGLFIKRVLLFGVIAGTLISTLMAQSDSIYLPLNVKNAFNKNTRSYDGNPGSAYWQNRSVYHINVELDPEKSILQGEETINYFNNSPDTLKQIVMRLYQNIYKKGNPRQFAVSVEDLTDGMELNNLEINGKEINLNNRNEVTYSYTNMYITLPTSLLPGKSIELKTNWQFHITRHSNIRMGQYGNGNFFVAYFYPQIAVYDDVDGWDKYEYFGAVEFYNDFSDFDVSVTVPSDYLVWGTGTLTNAEKVYKKELYRKYQEAQNTDSVIHLITMADYKKGKLTRGGNKNAWQFHAGNVTDFAFAACEHYLWDATSLVVDSATGRRVLTDAIYPDSALHYDKVAGFARTTIAYLSDELPGFPFSYPHITVFCNGKNGGGMEFPMMVNNGIEKDLDGTLGLTFHEIAHNYFPFIMGINERKYAWMDEGWATFLPKVTIERYDTGADYQKRLIKRYLDAAGKETDVPPIIPTAVISANYQSVRTASYYRPALAYEVLQNILGSDEFQKAIHEYVIRWKGKHPLPWDFFNTIENITGKNLSWFWKPWFLEYGYPDLGLGKIQKRGINTSILVKKIGNMPVPVYLTLIFDDGEAEHIEKSATVWENNNQSVEIVIQSNKSVSEIQLGNDQIPDVDRTNNNFKF